MPDNKTTKQVNPPNPTGKGGFAEHPENRSNGRWDKDNSFSYWFNAFKAMSVKEFESWKDKNPPAERSMAAQLAYKRIKNAVTELQDFREVADRTEGKAVQSIEHTGKDGDAIETSTTVTFMPKQLPPNYWNAVANADNDI